FQLLERRDSGHRRWQPRHPFSANPTPRPLSRGAAWSRPQSRWRSAGAGSSMPPTTAYRAPRRTRAGLKAMPRPASGSGLTAAPAGGSTMFAALNSKVSVDDLLHGAIIQSGNDSCIALAEGMAGNERIFAADFMTKRARELGMTKSTFGNSNGLPDPANKMTVRELANLARHLIRTYPDMYKLFGEKECTGNKIA